MNNLHRELAPISDAAWEQIEQEASRTLRRYLAARRVVDVSEAKGATLAAVGTGHTQPIKSPAEGVEAVRRVANAVVELRVPFTLTRGAIDDVERGSEDSDWSPLKEAARKIAYAENRAVFDGYAAAGIGGIRSGASNDPVALPPAPMGYPAVVARAVDRLRLAGVEGPYRLVLGDGPFTAISGGSEEGYPVLEHIRRLVEGDIVWAPGIDGGLVLTARGGDFELSLGQDLSIGYLSHTDKVVELYLQESFTFRLLTTEAAVALPARENEDHPGE